MKWTVDVEWTDRTRAEDGAYATDWRRVSVIADGAGEAALVAAQMVACVIHDGMVLNTVILV